MRNDLTEQLVELVLGNVVIALTPQKDTDEILQRPDSRDDLSAPSR